MSNGILVGEGLVAQGVLIDAPEPLGQFWFPLNPGLTVLYGRNGAGKTQLLRALSAALRGVALPGMRLSVQIQPTKSESGFDFGLIEQLVATDPLGDWELDGEAEPALSFTDIEKSRGLDALYERVALHVDELNDLLRSTADGWGFAEGRCHSPRFSLVASGTREEPSWDVWISVVPTELAEFASKYPFDAATWTTIAELGRENQSHELVFTLASQRTGDGWRDEPVPVHVAKGLVSSGPRPRRADSGDLDADGVIACLVGNERNDANDRTLAFIRSDEWVNEDGLLGWDNRPSAAVDGILSSLSRAATDVLRSFVGSNASLRATMLEPNRWLDGEVVQWLGTDAYGTELPIERLGAGSARWANMAISVALSQVRGDLPALVVIDEPERALHSAAQLDVAKAFVKTLDSIEVSNFFISGAVVATHSPAFLSIPGANLVHVTRGTDRRVRLEGIDTTIGVEGLVAELGLVRSDALLTTRCFMFVEGEHDEAVLRAFFGEELRERHVHLATMSGASNVEAFVNTEHLLAYSDARLRVVLDRVGKKATEQWAAAQRAFVAGERARARRELELLRTLPGRESEWLMEAGLAALNRGQLDRIDVIGLERPDIINYLPVEKLVPGATSWHALFNEYHRSRAGQPRPSFKDWLRKSKGVTINAARLGEIAGLMDPPGDLPAVLHGL